MIPRIIIVAIAIAAVLLFLFFKKGNITPDDEIQKLIADGALIVDVRTPEEFKTSNYNGAINIPLADIEKNLHMFGIKNRKIIVYCRSGNRSGKAKKINLYRLDYSLLNLFR